MVGRLCDREVAMFGAMLATETTNVVANTLFKAASSKGLSPYAYLVYSYSIGSLLLLLLPFAFFSYRSRLLPPLSSVILCKLGLLGLLGSIYLMAAFTGIKYTSPSLASSIANLTPAFTFLLSLLFRMEKVCIKEWTSVAKVMGTMVSIGGALVATLYHGPVVFSASPPSVSLRQPPKMFSDDYWVIGGGLLGVSYIFVSISYILQAHVMDLYPSAVTVTLARSVCIPIVSALVGLVAENNSPSAWIIRFNITLLAIVVGGIQNVWYYGIHSWVVAYKGPLYLSIFRPLSIIIAVATCAILLGDSLYLGSMIGGILISIGFYSVVLGKAKEKKMDDTNTPSLSRLDSTASDKAPLLENSRGQQV